MADYYQPPDNKDDLFAELGLAPSSASEYTLNPQPIIDAQPKKYKNYQDEEYASNQQTPQNQTLNKKSTYRSTQPFENEGEQNGMEQNAKTKETFSSENEPKMPSHEPTSFSSNNTKKNNAKPLRTLKRGGNRKNVKKSVNQQIQKPESMDIQMNEVAQWAEKGTKVKSKKQKSFNSSDDEYDEQEQEQQDSFEKDETNNKNSKQQQQIRKKIEQKLKNYDNKGSGGSSNKSTLSSLKEKANQLKQINSNTDASAKLEQSSQQLMINKVQQKEQQKKKPIEVKQQSQEEEQSEDPWDKINEKTLAKQHKKQEVLKEMENGIDLVNYFLALKLQNSNDDIQPQQQDQSGEKGFFAQICACLNPKKQKRGRTDIEKQIINISTVQLTNTAQQMQLLKEVWEGITHKKFLRYGQHWNQIGFQGRDPATDLRSTGILSLLHWNQFNKIHKQYENKLYNTCIEFDIPLALTHIKVTSLVVGSLRKNLLNGESWQDFQAWYNAFVMETFDHIIKNAKDLQQIGELVEQAVERTKKDMQGAMKRYNLKHKESKQK